MCDPSHTKVLLSVCRFYQKPDTVSNKKTHSQSVELNASLPTVIAPAKALLISTGHLKKKKNIIHITDIKRTNLSFLTACKMQDNRNNRMK